MYAQRQSNLKYLRNCMIEKSRNDMKNFFSVMALVFMFCFYNIIY